MALYNLDAEALLTALEKTLPKKSLIYLDPPYAGRALYRLNFHDADFQSLARRLRSLKGRFLLSINDHPVSRAAFAEFSCREISLPYTASRMVPRTTELLYSNYPLPDTAPAPG